METDLEAKVREALKNPENMGELPDADAVGSVGNSECGEMLRMWLKFREAEGKKVIEKASFQSFGCETAIAVASLATKILEGKTAEEAMRLSPDELSSDLGPLPPMKIHCAQLVEGALKSALEGQSSQPTETESSADARISPIKANIDERQSAAKRIKFL